MARDTLRSEDRAASARGLGTPGRVSFPPIFGKFHFESVNRNNQSSLRDNEPDSDLSPPGSSQSEAHFISEFIALNKIPPHWALKLVHLIPDPVSQSSTPSWSLTGTDP